MEQHLGEGITLVTGANGKAGRAVIRALLSLGVKVRALVHRAEQVSDIESLGAREVIAGDMMDRETMNRAFAGVRAAYHICSAVNPDEVQIGQVALEAARSAGVEHFVYHSVLHSVLQDMPHHQKKLKVEELLVESGIPFTIVQPAVFMQNMSESWALLERGVFQQKFFTTDETRICMVDLEDLAEAVSTILTHPGHTGATYEICGPENLSLSDVRAVMAQHFGPEIRVETPTDETFAAQLRKHGAGDYQVSTLLRMFEHYNRFGFVGNPGVLTWILGRRPTDLSSFILRTIQAKRSA